VAVGNMGYFWRYKITFISEREFLPMTNYTFISVIDVIQILMILLIERP
jgi:hypothetical protein